MQESHLPEYIIVKEKRLFFTFTKESIFLVVDYEEKSK
jgi:hypothetical protein